MSKNNQGDRDEQKDHEADAQQTIPEPPGPPSPPSPPINATAMKAFAHPLRMAMYDYLNDHGSATATMLARHTGESTGQTSYHLRQLERHGFVADDETRGSGRERWWKAVGFSMQSIELAKDSSARPAVHSMLQNQVSQHAAALTDWYARAEAEDPAWANISTNNRYTMLLTREEVIELERKVIGILAEYAEISEQRSGAEPEQDETMRRVRLYLDLFPMPEDE